MKVSTLSLWLPPYFLFAANLVYLLTSTCKFALADQVHLAGHSFLLIPPSNTIKVYCTKQASKQANGVAIACRRRATAAINQAAGFNSSWENRQVSSFLLKLYWYMAFELFIQGLFWWRAEEAILHVRRWVLCMEKSLFRLYNIHALYIVTSTPPFFKLEKRLLFSYWAFYFSSAPEKYPSFFMSACGRWIIQGDEEGAE